MSNSPLVDYVKISPNKNSPRNHKIDTITIHCVVGQCTVEALGDLFAKASRKGSSNYGIGADGRIGMYVEEKDRSWCSSNAANDHRAITIEVASDTTHPYAVNDKAYKALIELLVDICKRNGIKELKWKADKSLIGKVDQQNMTVHRWFANKACPGDYLYKNHGAIAEAVNAKLNPTNVTYHVRTGNFRNKTYAEAEYRKVRAAGFTASVVQIGSVYKVQIGAYKKKTNADATAKRLNAAGFKAEISTQSGKFILVTAKKSVDAMAREVIQGKWGSGKDRENRLTKAGYEYNTIQKRVNELL